jgi:hypothetical protein
MDLINFYMGRDGEESARKSILMQFEVSLRALLNAQSHATAREYRPRFLEDAILMCDFLGHDAAMRVMLLVVTNVSEKVEKMAEADALRAGPYVKQFSAAFEAILKNGAHASAILNDIRTHPFDATKADNTRKQVTVLAADLDRVKQLLQAENIPFSLS